MKNGRFSDAQIMAVLKQAVGLVDVPIEACSPKVSFGSFGQFRSKLLNPSVDGRPIHRDATFFKTIDDILVGQRISELPAHGTQDDFTGKTVVLER